MFPKKKNENKSNKQYYFFNVERDRKNGEQKREIGKDSSFRNESNNNKADHLEMLQENGPQTNASKQFGKFRISDQNMNNKNF